ncbi:MAG: pitrilysin family protein [Paracoccaceae bacterium]
MIQLRPLLVAGLLALAALPLRAATDIVEVTSPGGITAWLVEEHSIPMLAIELNFRGGAALDPVGQEGATTLMMGLLEEGAGDMDASAFLQASESVAARFRFNTGLDSVNISAQMLTGNRAESLALLRLALTEPRFDAVAVERVRQQVLSGLARDATDPGAIASAAFSKAAFGDHVYARNSDGTPETVAALDVAALRAAQARTLVHDRVVIGVVGDITAAELGPLLDELLGDLPKGGAVEVPQAEIGLSETVTVIDFPTPQAVAVFGQQGLARDDPDYLIAFVANHIFGGRVVTSRLNQALREERGLTYGVGTSLAPYDYGALISGRFSSTSGAMAEAVDVLRAEWLRMSQGVTAQELNVAKTYLTGNYALSFDSNGAIARAITGFQIAGLPRDYIETRNENVMALELDDVNRVVRRLFDPRLLHIIVVGQPTGLEPTQ